MFHHTHHTHENSNIQHSGPTLNTRNLLVIELDYYNEVAFIFSSLTYYSPGSSSSGEHCVMCSPASYWVAVAVPIIGE